jgi:5-methylcytosine-specific restriction protein A
MKTRNPQWTWNELILLLALYFRHDPRYLSSRHTAVQSLSRLLASSDLAGGLPKNDRFRNPDGIRLKSTGACRQFSD